MRRLLALLPLLILVIAGCSKSDETSGVSADTTTPPATTGNSQPDNGTPDSSAPMTSGAPNAKGPDAPLASAPEKTDPAKTDDPAGTTAAADVEFAGHYKATRGVGEEWVMYMLELAPTGDCVVKIMAASPKAGKAEERKGKWKQAGGMATIEWPGESPMILQLKGAEATATEFDKSKWPFERLIFYKKPEA